MIMATNKDEFTCNVCQKLYTNPVVHTLCGVSFDRQCIGKRCPAQECGRIINESDLIINHTLLKIADERRLKSETPPAYYLILLDTSSSMWYSDAWLPFAIGESRFTHAIQFLNDFFNLHMNSTADKISLVTFDTATIQRFDFETIKPNHLTVLQDLKCEGNDTALFDSIDYCLEKLEHYEAIFKNQMPTSYLFIITDGGNNFGKKESEQATKVFWRAKKLHISGHMIQIGDKNRKKTRRICDIIKFKYNHFNGGNLRQFVDSFSDTIKTETRARVSRTRPSSAQPLINLTALSINQLPDVPTEPIKIRSKQTILA